MITSERYPLKYLVGAPGSFPRKVIPGFGKPPTFSILLSILKILNPLKAIPTELELKSARFPETPLTQTLIEPPVGCKPK